MPKIEEDYEVYEVKLSEKEIASLIEELNSLNKEEHVHIQINKGKEIMLIKK